ncbi:unnamed protein product [Adineta steineri]|uniref:DUF1868 domain-containing protein n=1 Tax=Adineta steineri TaxID=433720 RepID=A0A813NGB5_9BILA|nr:unnamed protein product [Adineta steineri]
MDFEIDPLIEQINREEKKETFGLIICALFHHPKPVQLADFYQRLIKELQTNFNDDEKQSIYLYPIAHLHITITTLYNFKHAWPQSPEKCLQYWKECFTKLKTASKNQPIILTLDSIQLSKAAGYFQFKNANNGIENLRQSIQTVCKPADGQPPLHIPNIIHTSFLRFIKKPNDPVKFEEKFHRICKEIFERINEIRFEIDEICLAYESQPYMHIECDEFHVLDIMKC